MELRVWLLGPHVSAEQLSNRKNDKVYPVKQMACQLHPAQDLKTSEVHAFHSWLSPRQAPFAQQFMYKEHQIRQSITFVWNQHFQRPSM